VKYTPASSVECCLTPLNWLGWKMPNFCASNCNSLASIFSTNLPKVFSRTIGRNALGTEYVGFPGFGRIIELDSLKWDGQYPVLMQALAILVIFSATLSSAVMNFKCFHVTLSGPGVEVFKHFLSSSNIS